MFDRNNSEGRGGAIPSLGEIRNCHINVGTGKELPICPRLAHNQIPKDSLVAHPMKERHISPGEKCECCREYAAPVCANDLTSINRQDIIEASLLM